MITAVDTFLAHIDCIAPSAFSLFDDWSTFSEEFRADPGVGGGLGLVIAL